MRKATLSVIYANLLFAFNIKIYTLSPITRYILDNIFNLIYYN